MKKLLILIFLPVLVSAQFAYEGPIPKITSGYGSFGSVPFESRMFHLIPDSTFECEDTLHCIITSPTNATGILPTVFRFPGASNENLTDSVYWHESKLDREFVASNGYVSVTMQYNGTNEYGCAYYMLDEVIKLYPNLIDTSRVGIHGMSQGAGVTNWLSLKKFINDGWGANGRFAWPDAGASFFGWMDDWPNDRATQSDSGLAAMPDDVLYLMTLSDWDQVPDPRTLVDMYQFMGVPDTNKEFMIIRGDTVNSYIYWATHFTTNSWENDSSQFSVYITKHDALDYWLGTRLLHSLMAAAWDNDPIARRICMGNGDTLQTNIAGGQMRGPIVTDQPWMNMLASWNSGQGYMNDCEAPWNMRQYVTADACFTLAVPEIAELSSITLYPNPAKMGQLITLKTDKPIRSFEIFDALGRRVHSSSGSTFSIEKTGWYMLGLIFEDGTRQAAKFHILH